MATNLKDQLHQKDQEIELLHAIARIVNTTLVLDDLLKKLCEMVVDQMKADACLIYLLEDEEDVLVLRGSNSPSASQLGTVKLKTGEGVTGWVAEKRQVVAIPKQASDDPRFISFSNLKEDRYEAFLSVPILRNGKSVIGVLNVHHRKAHPHTDAEMRLGRHIAEEISGAIEHTRLIQEAARKSQAIQTLARMSQTITQGGYVQEILQLIVTMTAEMMGSKICSLMLLDPKAKELKIEATQSLSEAYKSKPPVPLKGSVSGRALSEKRAIVVRDVTRDPQYAFPDIARRENLRSLLVVPMMVKEKPVGVLNCYTSQEHDFTQEEIALVQAVANQAAVAIEHTRAMEQAVAAQEALETRKVVERAKGILMRTQGLTEDAAFRLIQRQAMDRRRSMKDVAEAIILSEEIQGKK